MLPPSDRGMDCAVLSEAVAVSTDLLREPLRDTLWRFLEECSLSSKGFDRVEQGSEEAARSRGNSAALGSIWQMQRKAHKGFRECRHQRVTPQQKAQKPLKPQKDCMWWLLLFSMQTCQRDKDYLKVEV